MFIEHIDENLFVAVCECCGEEFMSPDYEDFCPTCSPIMDDLEQKAMIALEAQLEDDLSYQEYLREHSA